MWRKYMEVARSELRPLATQEAHVTWERAKKGRGWGTHPVPHFFPRCLKETGKTATQVTPVYFILTGQRQVSKCTLSAFLVADMRTRFAILPTKEVFVLKAVCWMNCPPHGIQSRLFFLRSEQPHPWRCEFQGTVHPETVKTTVPDKLSFYPVE